MAVQDAAKGSTGGVDGRSMAVQNAARGSTGGVDEQSMAAQIAASGCRVLTPFEELRSTPV